MSPRNKVEHPVEVHPEYLAELKRRIETGPGLGVVAKAAGMSKVTLWRALHGAAAHRTTINTIERARAGLAFLEDGRDPLPPPVVGIRSAAQHAWLQLGDALLDEYPEGVAAILDDPEVIRSAVRAAAARRRR